MDGYFFFPPKIIQEVPIGPLMDTGDYGTPPVYGYSIRFFEIDCQIDTFS
jgi:hypothetical protein